MSNRIFTVLSIVLCIALAVTMPVKASSKFESSYNDILSKEEVLYAVLDARGEVKRIYAVNTLNIPGSGVYLDHGSYSTVKNLTTTDELIYDDGMITAYVSDSSSFRYYYQGDLESKSLPWNISIAYILDGTEASVDQLAGGNGYLETIIETSANPDINPSFAKNYLLQISVTLNTMKCANINAPGASIANAGINKILTYTVMPDTDGYITFCADVNDFELESISINAVPFTLDMDIDTSVFSSDLGTLEEAISLLNDGVTELTAGVYKLNGGADALRDGSLEFQSGISLISGNTEEITGGSAAILDALSYMSAMISVDNQSPLEQLSQLPIGLVRLADGLDEISGALSQIDGSLTAAFSALDKAFEQLPDDTDSIINEDILQELVMKNPDDPALSILIESYTAAQSIKGTFDFISKGFAAIQENLQAITGSAAVISAELNTIAELAGASLEGADISSSLAELAQGVGELKENYSSFHEGLSNYTGGVTQLADVYAEIHSGASGLSDGMTELYSAASQLSYGVSELNSKTEGLSGQIDSAIEEIMSDYDKTDFIPDSFISDQNENVVSVQFVIKTEKIVKEKAAVKEITESEAKSFWTRLRDLF